MPLAIELAASRIRVLTPAVLLRLLDSRLRLLVGGAADLPDRQRALAATLAWSYALLTPDEQALFRRLSVFVGGCSLSAAAAVGGAPDRPEQDVLDGLTALVDHSMVLTDADPERDSRFRMLETVREYGLERLTEHGDTDLVRARHAAYWEVVAETAEPALQGPDQRQWLERLEADHDNLRAALTWCLNDDATAIDPLNGPRRACAWPARWAGSGTRTGIWSRGATGSRARWLLTVAPNRGGGLARCSAWER